MTKSELATIVSRIGIFSAINRGLFDQGNDGLPSEKTQKITFAANTTINLSNGTIIEGVGSAGVSSNVSMSAIALENGYATSFTITFTSIPTGFTLNFPQYFTWLNGEIAAEVDKGLYISVQLQKSSSGTMTAVGSWKVIEEVV